MKNKNNSIKNKLEDFLYLKIIRNLMLKSRLGRQCVLGEASTGYNFDHMYKNEADGFSKFGIIIDYILLHLPAVKATRARKSNIIRLIGEEIQRRSGQGAVTKIVDLACGTGRYLSEIECGANEKNVEIVGIDYDGKSLAMGKTIAESQSVSDSSLRFLKGNVFRLEHLKKFGDKIGWRPNIVLVSGLFEYLPDEKVKEAFKQIYEGLDSGGLFLFFSQQNNPSKKLMEKVCKTNAGAWVLYYRQPSLLLSWLQSVGFEEELSDTDKWKMYNLFMVRKT